MFNTMCCGFTLTLYRETMHGIINWNSCIIYSLLLACGLWPISKYGTMIDRVPHPTNQKVLIWNSLLNMVRQITRAYLFSSKALYIYIYIQFSNTPFICLWNVFIKKKKKSYKLIVTCFSFLVLVRLI